MACFIPKNPGQQVGAGHVDVAVWLVMHCVCADTGGCKAVWGMGISGELVITQADGESVLTECEGTLGFTDHHTITTKHNSILGTS